ncbi:DNA-directed RNA polymerase I subunit Rpa14p [Monosporozyma unispora]|nr:hypothetical protein C6P44_004880 [Kazachstania unispora]
MNKGFSRGKFASTLHKPVVIHKIGKPTHATKDDILRFLDEFIVSKENLINNNVLPESDTNITTDNVMLNIDTNLTSALSQLKRIQRDFQGLPPQVSTITIPSATESEKQQVEEDGPRESKTVKSATGGTKKTFGDDE